MSAPGISRPVMSVLTMFSFEKSMAASTLMSSLVTVLSAMMAPVTEESARSSTVMVPSAMVPSVPPLTESRVPSSPSPRFSRAPAVVVAPVPPLATGIIPVTPAALPVMSPAICDPGIDPVICDDSIVPVTFEPLTDPIYWSAMGSPCQMPEMTVPEESTAKIPGSSWMGNPSVLPTVRAACGSVVPIPT